VGGQKKFFARSAREIVPPTFEIVAPPLPTDSCKFKIKDIFVAQIFNFAAHFPTRRRKRFLDNFPTFQTRNLSKARETRESI